MQFWQLVCASLLCLSVASCKKEATIAPLMDPAAPPMASADSVEIEVPAPKSGTISPGEKSTSLTDLQIKIGSIKKAIAAGKLTEAKTELTAVETAWRTMESGVLSKSPDRYKAIITSEIKSVVSGINSKKDKNVLLASLAKINQNIDILRK
jgi:hypothetical protein